MKRAIPALLALALVLAPAGCRRKTGGPVSVVRMSDPHAEAQLLSGFYPVEAGAWRWTKQKFSLRLAPPRGAAKNGAWLRVRVTAPDALIARLGTVTLSADVDGHPLSPETYSAAGMYTYERSVPGSLLAGESVTVNFAVDKTMAPAGAELRELGIVVMSAGLEPR